MEAESFNQMGPRHGRYLRWMSGSRIRNAAAWYLAEALIVFMGITGGFLFEEWRTDRDNWAKRKEVLESLRKDVVFKMTEISTDSFGFRLMMNSSIVLQKAAYDYMPYHDSLRAHYFNVFNIDWFFDDTTPAYQALKEQNDWDLIQSDSLRNQIYQFYESSLRAVSIFYDDVNNYHLNVMTPVMLTAERYRSSNGTPNISLMLDLKSVINHPSSASMFIRFSLISENTLRSLRRAHRVGQMLLNHLDYELARHGP